MISDRFNGEAAGDQTRTGRSDIGPKRPAGRAQSFGEATQTRINGRPREDSQRTPQTGAQMTDSLQTKLPQLNTTTKY